SPKKLPNAAAGFNAPPIQGDLDSKLLEIETSIREREKARRKQQRAVHDLRSRKSQLDAELTREMSTYDSAFLSQSRNLERRVATLRERLASLARDARIPEALARYETEADQHLQEAARLRREITVEKSKLSSRESVIRELEEYFLEALKVVGFPGFTDR